MENEILRRSFEEVQEKMLQQSEDIDHLTERIKELEAEKCQFIEFYAQQVEEWAKKVDEMEAENERPREALQRLCDNQFLDPEANAHFAEQVLEGDRK
jgi:Glu-tRNA(Gln) amidotransferase subunit E-like FAD-binding protein